MDDEGGLLMRHLERVIERAEIEPVTMQLREPEVKMMMPSSHVKRFAPRLDLMGARFLSMTSVRAVDAAGLLNEVNRRADQQQE